MDDYARTHRRSLADPVGFWEEQAAAVAWDRRWDSVLDPSDPPFVRWFAGGRLNTCHNAVDRHVEAGRGEATAVIWESPVTGASRTITFAELQSEVAVCAGALRALGVGKGDSVLIYMPMVPEAVVGMLACARIGAIHTVVFGGFAAPELATRIEDVRARVILTASCGYERNRVVDYGTILNAALAASAHKPEHCVILDRAGATVEPEPGRDLDWEELLASAEPAPCVAVEATDPLYVLHTSGTTGKPKGLVRDNGGHAVALSYSMRALYGVEAGDVFWAASDIGWVVGHSYSVYGPLLAGCATVIYEGKPVDTPDAGEFWRLVERRGVAAMFVAPTALRAIRREDPQGEWPARFDLGSLRTLFVAGERCDGETLAWAHRHCRVPVVNHWWQTETGWPISTTPSGLADAPEESGSVGVPAPGYNLRAFDDQGDPLPPGERGSLVIDEPLPPGGALTIWGNDELFRSAYFERFPGVYDTGDTGYLGELGSVFVMGRGDDVINVAGHRLSTGAIEEVIASHAAVAECAVIGVADPLKGQVPAAFVTLHRGFEKAADALPGELSTLVRETIGPIATLRVAVVVDQLPKTRSGKILRGTMREIAAGREVRVPATIEAPAALEEIAGTLERLQLVPDD